MLGDSEQSWKPGLWIGLARLGLVLVGLMVLAVGFPRTLRQFLHVWDPATWNPRRLTPWFRITFLTIAVVWGGLEASEQLDRGNTGPGAALVEWGIGEGSYASSSRTLPTLDAKFTSAHTASKIYAINYVLFFGLCIPLAIVIPVFSLVREDWQQLRQIRRELTAPGTEPLDRFKKLRGNILEHSRRYMRLLAITGAIVAFEQYIGFRVMPPDDQVALNVALGVVAMNALLLLVFGYYYYDCYQATYRTVSDNDDAVKELTGDYSPKQFVKLLLKYDFSGVIVVTLLISPFKENIPFLSTLLGA